MLVLLVPRSRSEVKFYVFIYVYSVIIISLEEAFFDGGELGGDRFRD